MFKTDGGGIALSNPDVKVSLGEGTWGTRLSQIGRSDKPITICTYSLPSLEYMKNILGKRTGGITLIAHRKFARQARQLRATFPWLKIILKPDVHSKYVLIEPDTVWISSANFGSSGWMEGTVGIHSKEAYQYMLKKTEEYIKERK